MHRRMRAVKRAHSRSRRRMRAVKRAHRRRTKKSATSCGAALGFSVSMKPELFAFGDGAGGAIVDASEAFDACASVDDGDAIFVDFDGLGGATRFARTTTNTRFSIYNRNCHFSSPKTATNQRLCAAPRRTPLCSMAECAIRRVGVEVVGVLRHSVAMWQGVEARLHVLFAKFS